MSTVAWLARCARPPANAELAARLHALDGPPAGWLVAWRQEERPAGVDARRVDRRMLDADGAGGVVSLVWPHEDLLIAFDDLAVQHARRLVLAGPPACAVSTLLVDDRRFAGALTVRRGRDAEARLREDPFARLGPRKLLRVEPGIVGAVAAPTGPTIERHGSAQPWPWSRFPA